MRTATVAILMLLGLTGTLFAGGPSVPEIDPTGAPGALALLGGALLVLRGRRRR
jgi:hypothetical protein